MLVSLLPPLQHEHLQFLDVSADSSGGFRTSWLCYHSRTYGVLSVECPPMNPEAGSAGRPKPGATHFVLTQADRAISTPPIKSLLTWNKLHPFLSAYNR